MLADWEHTWAPVECVPPKLEKMFPDGIVIVFADEEFIAAIPASRDKALELIDLFVDGDEEYFKMRERLCEPFTVFQISSMFHREMEKDLAEEQRQERGGKYAKMAKAARFN